MRSTRESQRDKILIFIVTLDEIKNIPSVLDILPKIYRDPAKFHILVLNENDGSNKHQSSLQQAETGTQLRDNVTMFTSPIHLGYGGNQKIGYRYAIEKGYGLVIYLPQMNTLSGDSLNDIVRAWETEKTDVILPSAPQRSSTVRRMFADAEKKISGIYASVSQHKPRAYSVEFLSRIPFELNSDKDHFDVEILLQGCALGARIVETPSPTGSAVLPDQPLSPTYFWNSLKSCLKFRFQKIGFFCTLQYRGLLRHDTRYSDKSDYWGSSHQLVLSRLRVPSKVLDLGCGPGFVSKKLKEYGCYVIGVDAMPVEHYPGDQFIQLDLEQERLPANISTCDYVLLLDVLEHLSDPESFLIRCRYSTGSDKPPTFMISTGNVAFIGVRALLGLGFFNYGERGILDVTHKRLFTLHSFRRMLRDTGYEIQKVDGVGVPFQLVFTSFIGRLLSTFSSALAKLRPSLFAYQIIIEAKPKPHSLMLLSQLEEHAQ
jgi:SAM-dependent methyltransferase